MKFTFKSCFSAIMRDPLVHFFVLGIGLYLLVSFGVHPVGEVRKIVVTQETSKRLGNLFEITWQRKPDDKELAKLIEKYIKEEIYYREALQLGLDKNDIAVRQRMNQKMQILLEDSIIIEQPTEEEIIAFYSTHEKKYNSSQNQKIPAQMKPQIIADYMRDKHESSALTSYNQLSKKYKIVRKDID